MKITPVAQPSVNPGESLTSTNVGRTADPMKMNRARAIARGEKVPELDPNTPPQEERARPDVRKLKMRTNFSTDREMPLPEPEEAVPAPTNEVLKPTNVSSSEQSSTPDAVEPGAVEATQPLSPQFAALAKQKRALQLERAEFEKLKAESTQQGTKPAEDFVSKLKSNPLSVLQEHGALTPEFYNALTEQLLNGQGSNPELQALKEEIDALKKGVETQFQTREAQQEEAALTEMLYEAEALAKEGDTFEMIRSEGEEALQKVLRLIHSTYKKSGRVLDVTEAMNTIETQLLARAEKLASINKVRAKIAPPEPNQQLQPQQRGMRTLTARDTAAPQLDRRARAIAAAMGTLKR